MSFRLYAVEVYVRIVVWSIVRSERNQERETTETQNRLHPRKIRNSQNAQCRVVDNQKLKSCTLKLFCKSLVPKSVPF